jgi:transcription-repair coupling factor (superfamily II helicase)
MKIVFIRDVEDLEERLKATTAILRNLVRIAGKTKKAA